MSGLVFRAARIRKTRLSNACPVILCIWSCMAARYTDNGMSNVLLYSKAVVDFVLAYIHATAAAIMVNGFKTEDGNFIIW